MKINDSQIEMHSSPVSREGKLEVITYTGDNPIPGKKIEGALDLDTVDNISRLLFGTQRDRSEFADLCGLNKSKPSIVQTCDFKPLYDNKDNPNAYLETDVYTALSMKEKAKLLTSKVAISTFNANTPVVSNIEANRRSMLQYAERDISFISKVIERTTNLKFAMTPHLFKSSVSETFMEYLKRLGYYPDQFSPSKVWQLTLLYFMRDVMFHRPELIGEVSNSVGFDSSHFELPISSYSLNNKRIWINSARDIDFRLIDIALSGIRSSTLSDSEFSKAMSSAQQTDQNRFAQTWSAAGTSADNNMSWNLEKDYKVEAIAARINSFYQRLYSNLLISDTLDPNRNLGSQFLGGLPTGIDIATIANAFYKELNYSYMIDTKAAELQSDFGYSVDKFGDNKAVWQHIIGKFEKTALDINQKLGKGNSLKDISSVYIEQDDDANQRKILTFEDESLELREEASKKKITSGFSYYLDEAFDSTDKKNFNVKRLEDLLRQLRKSDKANDYIDRFVVTDDNEVKNNLEPPVYNIKSPLSAQESLLFIKNKLSVVERIYRSVINTKRAAATEYSNRPVLKELNYQSIRNLPEDDARVRGLAIMCKLVSYPPASVSRQPISRLKSRMFVWLIKKCYESLTENLYVSSNATQSAEFESSRMDSAEYSDMIVRLFSTDFYSLSENPSGVKVFRMREREEKASFLSLSSVGLTVEVPRKALSSKSNDAGYLDSESSIRFLDLSNKLTSAWVDLMKPYVRQIKEKNLVSTSYSQIDQIAMLMSYFDIILRMTASMCPEKIVSEYNVIDNKDENYDSYYSRSYGIDNTGKSAGFLSAGYLIGIPTSSEIIEHYPDNTSSATFDQFSPSYAVDSMPSAVKNAYRVLNEEKNNLLSASRIINEFVDNIKDKVSNTISLLKSEDSQKYLKDVWEVYDKDVDLSEQTKHLLFKTSFKENQLKLHLDTLTEYSDRFNETSEGLSRVSKMPVFNGFSRDSMNYLPVDNFEVASFTLLSRFFGMKAFNKEIGGNKKILTIGLPSGLIESVTSTRGVKGTWASNLSLGQRTTFSLLVHKIDHLHPMVVYKPMVYTFNSSLFPTRVLSNWPLDVLKNESSDFPMRFHKTERSLILKSIDDIRNEESFATVPLDILKSLYYNHKMSFLAEQYIKWFTSMKTEDSRYYNYDPVGPESILDSQLPNFANLVKKSDSANSGMSKAIFQATSGEVLEISTSLMKSGKLNTQKYLPNLTPTIISYFENNETLFVDPLELTKRAVYPGKFDRVFNVIIDPDDFEVDGSTLRSKQGKEEFDRLVSSGNLKKMTRRGVDYYKHRDTNEKDVIFDEYFVSVSPLITGELEYKSNV